MSRPPNLSTACQVITILNSRTRSLIAIAVVPVALVGIALWWVTGLVPECSNTPQLSLDSPDATRSLVVFTRACGAGSLNTQAVITPVDGTLEGDAIGFLALEGHHIVPCSHHSSRRYHRPAAGRGGRGHDYLRLKPAPHPSSGQIFIPDADGY
jgi:hypothetical protein